MRIVGNTNPISVYIASKDEPLLINEFVVIDNKDIGEVIETIGLDINDKDSLLKFDINSKEDYKFLAKVKLLRERKNPVNPESIVRKAKFEDVKNIFIKDSKEDALALGIIKGTESISDIPMEYSNIMCLYEQGSGIQNQEGIPFLFNYRRMNEIPHIGLFGGSGSGKSYALRVISEEIKEREIPNIIIDPHSELEFSKYNEENYIQNKKLDNQEIFEIGKNISINFTDISSDELAMALSSSSQLTEVMYSAVRRIHIQGESLESFKNRLNNLIQIFEEEELNKNKKVYSSEVSNTKLYKEFKNDISGVATLKAISWRFNNLLTLGLFNDIENKGIDGLENALLSRKTIILRGSIKILNIFTGFIVKHFYKLRKLYKESIVKSVPAKKIPPYIITLDEAHNFCPKSKLDNPTKSIIREIAQEGRKYGVFLMLASQRPALIDDTVVALLSTKFIFRTIRYADKQIIESETDLNELEIKRLSYLNSGDAFVSSGLLGRTMFIKFRASKTVSPHKENPFEELNSNFNDIRKKNKKEEELIIEYIKEYESISSIRLNELYRYLSTRDTSIDSIDELEKRLNFMANNGVLIKDVGIVGDTYRKA